ncbi:MAG: hypothetical protein KOO60_01440 [Gemmatimonadales bacterium]|nr:hypothetical protein [Gemmatimonadales bacterium]
MIKALNQILRGWVQYFAMGHSSRCFSFVRDWVEKKIRRHLNRARLRPGFGWKRNHGRPYQLSCVVDSSDHQAVKTTR